MSFINPDFDINVNLGRLLVLINELSFNNKLEKILTIDRIALYDYLLKHPIALVNLFKQLNKRMDFEIKDYEVDSLAALFPNTGEIFRFKIIKNIVQILIIQNLVELTQSEGGSYFISITEKGKGTCSELNSEYFLRIKDLAKPITGLHSHSFTSLRNILKTC